MTIPREPFQSRDRGVALLLVLGAIVIVSTASIGVMRVVLEARTKRAFDHDARTAAEVLRASEAPILEWLVSASNDVVLETSADIPEVKVLRDRFYVGDREVDLEITAFDAFGMAPVDVMRRGGPLKDLLPSAVVLEAERVAASLSSARALDELVLETTSNPFPSPRRGHAGRDSTACLGAYLSFANPFPGDLNVNTAPVSYLQAVFAKAKRGGFSKWVVARDRGERLVAPSLGGGADGDDSDTPRLTSESTAWYLRIDVRVGRVHRAWWALYEAGSAMEWICASRISIP